MWRRIAGITFLLTFFFSFATLAQPPAEQWALPGSKTYAAEIKAYQSRATPKRYSSASEQKMFATVFNRKNTFLAQQLSTDEIIREAATLDRCREILRRMQAARPDFPFGQVQVFIHRSAEANASCFGEGTLFINLGLLLQLENDDELALLMGHELAHQFLGHVDSSTAQRIALAHSTALKKEVKAIRKSDEDRLEKIRSLKKRLAEVQGEYSRRHELEADSLGLLLARQAGYQPGKAAVLLLRLDASDELWAGKNLYDLQKRLGEALPGYAFAQKLRYTGLSGVKVNLNAEADLDSLKKTHPDCQLRFGLLHPGAPPTGDFRPLTLLQHPNAYKEQLLKEQVRYFFENNQLSLAAHYTLLALENGYSKPFFQNFLSALFARLYAVDRQSKRFEALTAFAPPGSSLQKLQNFLTSLRGEQLAALSRFFLSPGDGTAEAYAFARLAQEVCLDEKPYEAALERYQQQFPQPVMAYLLAPAQ